MYYAMLSLSFIVCGFYALLVLGVENNARERVASLVVLPPIVLGYDELYDDGTPATAPATTAKTKDEIAKRENREKETFKRMQLPWNQLIAYEDPKGGDSIIIPEQRVKLRSENGGFNMQNEMFRKNSHRERFTQNAFKEKVAQNPVRVESLLRNEHRPDRNIHKIQGPDNKETISANEIVESGNSTKNETIENVESDKQLNIANVESRNHNEKLGNKVQGFTDKIGNVGHEVTNANKDEVAELKKSNGHMALLGKGMISDPLDGDSLNFQGKFVLPNKLFDCPCRKNKS